ncbi:MAG: hypothetical protein CFE45_12675 [Burkholderiales bacterium PBB5]|nr:MAG: hypothetical protein CFE45_12675 [Burkholderiales bacterium PBB5]
MTVDNKGLVNASHLLVGVLDGSQGTVKVSGTGSQLNVSFATQVGEAGVGRLTIEGGSVVRSGNAWLGMNPSGNGIVTVTGIGSQWNVQSELRVGHGGTGTLNIENGGMVSSSDGYVGVSAGSNGAVKVTGANSQWSNAFNLYIGQAGTGSLHILDSGKVTASKLSIGNKGSVTLDGGTLQVASGSMSSGGIFNWIKGTLGFTGDASIGTGLLASTTTVGSGKTLKVNGRLTNDNGILKIDNGGVVSSAQGAIGYSPGSSGTVTLTGAKSSWRNAGDLSVGYAGTGSLNVLAGAEVSSVDGYIGREGSFGSLAMVSGAGSRWAASGTLYVNNGSLNVGNGGVASSQSAFVGAYAGRTGTVTVTGAGSQWNNTAALYVGLAGAGTLSIENGGLVSSAGGAIGAAPGGSGTVTVTGANSTWRNTGDLGVGQGGSAVLSILDFGRVTTQALRIGTQGTLNLGQGARLSTVNGTINNNTVHFTGDSSIAGRFTNNGSVVGSAGTLRFDNDVSGAGRYAGDIQFNAHYGPGNSPAAVDFGGGHVTFGSDAVLDIEVFGATPGTQYAQLLHIHTLTFNGTLNLIFSDGYVPAPGSLLTLFDFASFSGSLSADHITVSGYDKRLLDFSRLGTDGSLSVTAVPEPAHWALMLAGLVGLVWKTRRQRAAHAMA